MKKTAAEKKAKDGFTAADMRAVSDNPVWTKEDFAKARPFDEVFPGLRRGRGANKNPTKERVTIRLSRDVLDHFKRGGKGWQTRIDDTLANVVRRKSAG